MGLYSQRCRHSTRRTCTGDKALQQLRQECVYRLVPSQLEEKVLSYTTKLLPTTVQNWASRAPGLGNQIPSQQTILNGERTPLLRLFQGTFMILACGETKAGVGPMLDSASCCSWLRVKGPGLVLPRSTGGFRGRRKKLSIVQIHELRELHDLQMLWNLPYLLRLQNFCHAFSEQQHRVPIVQRLKNIWLQSFIFPGVASCVRELDLHIDSLVIGFVLSFTLNSFARYCEAMYARKIEIICSERKINVALMG